MGEGRKRRCLGAKRPGGGLGWGGYLAQLPGEPFRLFFPAGVLVSVVAVLLWPMFYAGWVGMYPAVAHSRLMIGGFVAAFAVGFMGTAAPRFLGAPKLTRAEMVPLLGFYLAAVVAQLSGRIVLGDVLFLGFLCIFVLALAVRVACRTSVPPPGMILAGMGLLCALAGAYLIATETRVEVSSFRFRLARLLLHEGFVLLPIMGIGSFLFPRFFGGRSGGEDRPGAEWRTAAGWALFCGLAVIAAIALDAAGSGRAGGLLRAAVAGAYLLATVPELYRGRPPGTMGWCLRVAVGATLLSLAAAPFFPAQRVGLNHLLFVSGYGLLAFTVGGRVLFGHSGELAVVSGRSVALRWVMWLALFAATTRAVADFVPKIRISHHIYAALLWVAVIAIWSWLCLPKVRRAEAER